MIDKTYRDALTEAEVRMSLSSEPQASRTYASGAQATVTVAEPCVVCGSTTPGRHYAPGDEPMTRRARILFLGFLALCFVGAVVIAEIARSQGG